MSTTKQFTNIKAGQKYQIDASARGYYDFRTTTVAQPNNPLSYDMKVYDGLNYKVDLTKNDVRPAEINFDGTVLPYIDNNELKSLNYVFGESETTYEVPVYEKVYDNLNFIGSPTINNDIASDFSRDNYLTLNIPNYSSGSVDSFEIVMKVHTPIASSKTSNGRILNSTDSYDNLAIDLGTSPGFNFCNKTIGFSTTFDDDIDLWVKITFDGSNLTLSHSLDGVTYTEDNTSSWDKSDVWFTSNTYSIGLRSYDFVGICYWNGTIDLSSSYVKINDNTIELGKTELVKIYIGYSIDGTLTLNDTVVSGIQANSRLNLPNTRFNKSENILVSFTTGSDVTTGQIFFDCGNIGFRVYNGSCQYYNRKTDAWVDMFAVSANTGYKIKIISKSDSSFSLGYALINEETFDFIDVTDVDYWTLGTMTTYVGNQMSPYNAPFFGSVDVSNIPCDFKVKTESKTGIFKDYTDNGKAKTLNCFSCSNDYAVLSPNEDVIYYYKHQYNDWIQPILSSDGTMGGDLFAVNSSSILRAGREAYKAFDGDTSTIDDNWHSSQGHPSWIEWYNPNPLKITRIKIQNRNSADGGSFVNTYKLSYSDDYSNWVDLLSGTSPSQENFTYWNIDITEENPHKYWRLTCLTSSGSNSDYTSIQTIGITAQEYVSLKGTPDDYDEIVKYTYLGTVDIPKHNIYNVDNFYGWANDSTTIFTKTLQLSTDILLYNSSYKQDSTMTISSFTDDSITLQNDEVYTRNKTLDKHFVLPKTDPSPVEPSDESDVAIAFNEEVANQDLGSDIYVNSGQGINEYYYTAYPVNDTYKSNSTILATISKKTQSGDNTLIDFDRKEESKVLTLDVSTNEDDAVIIANNYEPTKVDFNIVQDDVNISTQSYNDGNLPSSKYSMLNFKFNVDVTDDEVEIVVDGIKYKLSDLPIVANIASGYGVKVNKSGYKPYQTVGRKWYKNVININLETEE